ncbi:neurotactin [Condylostylus longicornis]|uniref:neurotactin n=1 Tax=Condylostylus longicornis TaxID=2530218 RepID=UPI00244D9F42|nr:neurotactin [Condylostylus longicornis]
MGELDDKETPPPSENQTTTESHHESEEPKETDKMLDMKSDDDKKKKSSDNLQSANDNKTAPSLIKSSTPENKTKGIVNGEEIINIPEIETKGTEGGRDGGGDDGGGGDDLNDSKKVSKLSKEDREVKPKKIPIGGIKMPGFFTKIKPRGEGDGADGELLEKDKETDDNKENEEKPKVEEKKPTFGDRIRNFFSKKPKNDDVEKATSPNTEAKTDDTQQAPKKGLLNAIKLPIANMIPKKKTEDDVEMGTGPGTKAGLASMETLDDSLKDADTVDKVPISNDDGVDKLKGSQEIKQNDDKANEDEVCEHVPLIDRIRAYKCSIDDILIAIGALLFIILLIVIGVVLSYEKITQAPIREGKFIDASTSCGMVEGLIEDNTYIFRGIPYALPPVGELRFKSAQLITDVKNCWNGTLKAHNETDICAQVLNNGTKIGEEDCLTLEIVTPHVRYDNPVPIVVLIGVESLMGGTPTELKLTPQVAKKEDVIFVRPNFRVGPLGFLALNVLTKDTYPQTSGNYGLSDIIAALKWIQLNIHHFGGDKNQVTLLGHQAGGTLVTALVTSREAKNLFSRAWVSSGGSRFPGISLKEAERKNEQYMSQIECQDVDCLRDASVEQILDATPDIWRQHPADLPNNDEDNTEIHEWLVLDGIILQKNPEDVWKEPSEQGQDPKKPKLVLGTTAHTSHNKFLYNKYTNWTEDEVRRHVEQSKFGFLNLTDEVLNSYNATYKGLISMVSDIRTICPLYTIAVKQQPFVPFYVVHQPNNEIGLANVNADIEAILGSTEDVQNENIKTPEEKRYSETIRNMFYKYIQHGTLDTHQANKIIKIGQELTTSSEYSHCNYWIQKDIVPRYARMD